MTKRYEAPTIRKITIPTIARWLKCDIKTGGCGYTSGKLSFEIGEVWQGADCPHCGKRLSVDHTERH